MHKATTKKSTYKNNVGYYPVIKFFSAATGEMEYFINVLFKTRSAALSEAKKHIKNLK